MFRKKKKDVLDFKSSMENLDGFLNEIHSKKGKNKIFGIIFKILRIFLIFISSCLLVVLVVASLAFFRFKGVFDLAQLGKASLEYSLSNAKRGDFTEMVEAATRAEGFFNDILKELNNSSNSFIFQATGFTRDQIADVEYLAKSASIISRSLGEAGSIAQKIDDVLAGQFGQSFSQFSDQEKTEILKVVYESGPELNGVKANLELALLNLDRIKANALFLPIKGKIDEVREQLAGAVDSLSKLTIISQLVPQLAGYPEMSSFLVLFQNSSELRATGGFIGTYGILEIANGDIVRFDTHDIYHMDMPIESGKLMSVEPPKPIKDYLNKNWYMRDANWSPDFPTSAEKVVWFFKEEDARLPEKNKINDFVGEFDGVISITPKVVADILAVIGEVNVNGDVYSKDNFINLLEYKVEQDFWTQNISEWERKEVIGDILEQIKTGMFDLHYTRWPELAKVLDESVSEKDLLIYFKDNNLENLAKDLQVAGEMKQTDGDYLMVVDSNMAALKTDLVMDREIKYEVEEREEKLVAKLTLDYTNNGVKDWRTGDYHTYTRVYVPKGSKIIKSEGISKGSLEKGEELGKTFFAGFISVRLGKKNTFYLEYELPDSIKKQINNGQYKLFVQKQPGKDVSNLLVDFKAKNAVKSYNLVEKAEMLENGYLRLETDLNVDKEFSLQF